MERLLAKWREERRIYRAIYSLTSLPRVGMDGSVRGFAPPFEKVEGGGKDDFQGNPPPRKWRKLPTLHPSLIEEEEEDVRCSHPSTAEEER